MIINYVDDKVVEGSFNGVNFIGYLYHNGYISNGIINDEVCFDVDYESNHWKLSRQSRTKKAYYEVINKIMYVNFKNIYLKKEGK